MLAGCIKTSRVDDQVTNSQLAGANKAVALMRLGSASPNCINVFVLLGRRSGEGYVGHTTVTVALVRWLTETQVAEVELDPGEHHIIAYKCMAEKGSKVVSDPAGGHLYGTSYARFTLAAGEIVNVGYFHFGASKEGRSLFGRKVRTDVEVGDWPLNEIKRFSEKRPAMFAKMVTRLMTVDGPASAQEQQQTCDTWAKLKAERKVQDVPAECGGATTQKKRT